MPSGRATRTGKAVNRVHGIERDVHLRTPIELGRHCNSSWRPPVAIRLPTGLRVLGTDERLEGDGDAHQRDMETVPRCLWRRLVVGQRLRL